MLSVTPLGLPGSTGGIMKLTFIGSTSETGNCPSLYATDRGTIVVQGRQITDAETLGQLRDVLSGEAFVEVPRELFRFAPSAVS